MNKFLEDSVVERCLPLQAEENLGEVLELQRVLVVEREGEEATEEEKWREATAWNCTASMADNRNYSSSDEL